MTNDAIVAVHEVHQAQHIYIAPCQMSNVKTGFTWRTLVKKPLIR